MKAGLLVAVYAMVLGGCAGTESYFDGKTGTRMIDTGTVNALNPSSSLMEVERCDGEVVQAYEWEENFNDGTVIKHYQPEECKADGGWRNVKAIGGYQPGYAMAPVTTAIGGAAFAVGMDRLGSGIGDSGSTTTNNNDTSSNGGNSSSLSSNRNESVNQNFNTNATSSNSSKNDYTFNKGKRR